jgi:2-oxoglutarate ferredoxin oxidoreductase subunit alpha
MKRIEAVNDFVVKFANVNGSGSASANELFAKSFIRMGIPVSPRNIFPSNIQGLPTWYEVRVTEKGWLGRRGGADLVVAMNPQTWNQDVKEVEPGGYLFYDNTKVLPQSKFRDDIHVIAMPLTEICAQNYTDSRERQLFKNIMYVGALASLMDIDPGVIAELIGEQYKGKEKLLKPNLNAFQMGHNYAQEKLKDALGLKAKRAYAVGDQIFMEGNAAAALGCVYGGATVCAWYPITPSSSVAEAFQRYCSRLRVDPATGKNKFAIIQAEDELASIGIVTGAGWNGARAFTATSGPGISLMSEFIGLAYFAEIPCTIIDVQRGGPSTGMPTRTQQSDLLACAYASHGDTKHVLLFPEDPHECFEHAAAALDLADRLQTPVFVMTDLDIGMNHRLCQPFHWDEQRVIDRGKVMTAADLDAGKTFGRYLDVDGDGIPYRTYPSTHPTKGAYFTRGTTKDEYARYSEEGAVYVRNMERLQKKFGTAARIAPQPIRYSSPKPTRFGVIYFGSTHPSMVESLEQLEAGGNHVNALRVRSFPFAQGVEDFIHEHDRVFIVEQNRDAQLRTMLMSEFVLDGRKLVPVLHYDGTPITARFITADIEKKLGQLKVVSFEKAAS